MSSIDLNAMLEALEGASGGTVTPAMGGSGGTVTPAMGERQTAVGETFFGRPTQALAGTVTQEARDLARRAEAALQRGADQLPAPVRQAISSGAMGLLLAAAKRLSIPALAFAIELIARKLGYGIFPIPQSAPVRQDTDVQTANMIASRYLTPSMLEAIDAIQMGNFGIMTLSDEALRLYIFALLIGRGWSPTRCTDPCSPWYGMPAVAGGGSWETGR